MNTPVHCVKSVRIRKCLSGTRKTPNTDMFNAVKKLLGFILCSRIDIV